MRPYADRRRSRRAPAGRARAFTLLELLVVVALLGIAGAMVIPSLGSVGVLRVQAAIRTLVSDITFAQCDAMAFQEQRAIVFDAEVNRYTLVEVPGSVIDVQNNTMYDPTRPGGLYAVDMSDARFGGARMSNIDFDGDSVLIFDALGGPVTEPGGNTPGAGGSVTVSTPDAAYRLTVDAFTGRVTVTRLGS